jgi:hypothetical protein
MPTIENGSLAVTCDVQGGGVTVRDQRRGMSWTLDPKTWVYGTTADLAQREILVPVVANKTHPDTLEVTLKAGNAQLAVQIVLRHDHVEVRTTAPRASDIRFFSIPGSFTPDSTNYKLLLPIMQGMLWDGKGKAFDVIRGEGSHLGFSMPFIGYLAEKGGLLIVTETRDDSQWWFGKDSAGRFWATNIQVDSLGGMRYPRVARLYPTDASIVAVAKCYRHYVQKAGRFVSWEDKLARRPNLERLFGALMCFIGYCQDDDLDYLAAFRKLKAYGFERALVYPVRFNSYDKNIVMGGQPAIHLSKDQVSAIKAMGYDVAPWSWLNERLDDKTEAAHAMFRRDATGQIKEHWAIDDQQWYHVCYSFIEAYQRQVQGNEIADMTWDHFDVLSCVPPQECYALDHAQHPGQPLSRTDARDWIRKTFRADQAKGWPVSSENFNDAYACEYDIGSVKAWPQCGPWPFWPIPLTMLVYHDSLIHSWWEVHNYNSPWFGRTRAAGFFEYGGGRPRLMATLDALMGCPPDVFPFGAQYGWTGRGKQTFLYKYRFEDPEVQIALREALPVAQLHRSIGKLEMVDFEILSEDGYVQASTFADGTRVIANFSRDIYGGTRGIGHVVLAGVDALMPESWKAVR